MKFKLKRIDWYIIKQFLGTYIFAIALIIAISVVFDINEKIDKFLSPDVAVESDCLRLLHELHPYFANLFSPLFTFIAVIFFTSKLADNSEVIAMLASGMSFRRLMLPLRDFGRDHCTQYVCAERLYHSACQRHAYRLPKQIYQE